MKNTKQIKLKIIDNDTKESIIITLDYSQLTSSRIKECLPLCIQLVTTGDSKLLFLGDKHCKLDLETLYNIASLFQSLLSGSMIWDVIGQLLPEDQHLTDLDGYLILNVDSQNQSI